MGKASTPWARGIIPFAVHEQRAGTGCATHTCAPFDLRFLIDPNGTSLRIFPIEFEHCTQPVSQSVIQSFICSFNHKWTDVRTHRRMAGWTDIHFCYDIRWHFNYFSIYGDLLTRIGVNQHMHSVAVSTRSGTIQVLSHTSARNFTLRVLFFSFMKGTTFAALEEVHKVRFQIDLLWHNFSHN